MTIARLSPSGPAIDVETTTDGIENLSSVPGESVTEALDYLIATTSQQFFDEFLGGTSVTLAASNDGGLVGSLAWNFVTSGGSCARNTSNQYVGAYDVTANASLVSALYLITTTAGTGGLPISIVNRVEWRARPSSTGGGGSNRIGIGNLPGTANFGNDGIYFVASSGSAFWVCTCRASGVNTNVTTTVPWNTGEAFDLVIVRNSATNYTFFINGALVATITTTVPTARIVPVIQMQAAAGGADAITVDTFRLNYTSVPL